MQPHWGLERVREGRCCVPASACSPAQRLLTLYLLSQTLLSGSCCLSFPWKLPQKLPLGDLQAQIATLGPLLYLHLDLHV